MAGNPDLLRATLETIILQCIAGGATYGYEIAKAIEKRSEGELLAQEGTLYPALHRLEKKAFLRANWRLSPEGRKRKHYRLTAAGNRHLASLRDQWQSFSETVNRMLGIAHARIVTA